MTYIFMNENLKSRSAAPKIAILQNGALAYATQVRLHGSDWSVRTGKLAACTTHTVTAWLESSLGSVEIVW